MRTTRRTRIIGGIAAGASATAVVGGLVLGTPSAAGEAHAYRTLLKPESIDDTPLAALVQGEQQVVGAAGAGSYVVQRVGDHLTIVAASPASGWKVDVLHNDADVVKAVFTSTTTKVFAVAKLADDEMVAVEAFEEAIPLPPPVAKVVDDVKSDVRAAGFGDDHDGWCGDKGDWDGDWDGDRDGKRDGRRHRGERDD